MRKKAIIFDLDNTIYPVSSIGDKLFDSLYRLIEQDRNYLGDIVDIKQDIQCLPFQVVARKYHFSQSLTDKGIKLLADLEYHEPIAPYEDYSFIKEIDCLKLLVTSGSKKLQESKISHLNLRNDFDYYCIIDPSVSQQTKKDAFQSIALQYKLKPEEILIVGDDIHSEIKAAKELGMDRVVYDHNGNMSQLLDDKVIHSYAELINDADIPVKRELSLSTQRIKAFWVKNEKISINEETIVLNLSDNPLILNDLGTAIQPWESSLLQNIEFEASNIITIKVADKAGLASECLSRWKNYHEINPDYPLNYQLYISPQDTVCTTEFNPARFGTNDYAEGVTRKFEIKLNFWYSPSNNNCGIHNTHDFLEIHTQVYGKGHMLAFKTVKEDSLFRDYSMLPGNTQEPWFIIDENGNWKYPWHCYFSETDCVWMAIEFHPINVDSDGIDIKAME